MHKTIRVFVLVLTLLGLSTMLFGQAETGQITGTVHDPTGAVVLNAKVTVKSLSSGLTREAVTSSAGLYAITNLRPDTYEVTVTAAGFQKTTKKIQVLVGQAADGNVTLALGSSTQTIEVSADTTDVPTVNTENQTVSETIGQKQMEALPNLNRNPYSLVATAGNVSTGDDSGRGVGVAINGQRSASTDILLDGGENVDLFTAGVGQTVPLDSVQEFSVVTNSFTAEMGRAGGGVVNVATKSGTNQLHGSVYEYNRVSALATNSEDNNVNDVKKPVFTRNQFGYSVGGPVMKNKLFFFSSTEWVRVRSSATTLAAVLSPASIATLPANAQAFFSGQTVRSSAVKTGTATSGGLNFDLYSFGYPSDSGGGSPQNTFYNIQRIDWNITDKTQLWGRYSLQSNNFLTGTNGTSIYSGFDTGENQYNNNIMLNLQHIWNNSLVTQTKLVFNRLNDLQPLGEQPVQPTLYTSANGALRLPNSSYAIQFPGYLPTSPGSAIPFGGPQNVYQFSQDVSWSKNRHQIRFGGMFMQLRDNRTFGAYQEAVEALSTSDLATALTNLQAGVLAQFSAAVNPQGKYPCYRDLLTGSAITTPECTVTLPVSAPSFTRHNIFNESALYLQDAWKVSPRWTVNLGVRWDYFGVLHGAGTDEALSSNFYFGQGNNIWERLRNGQVMPVKQSAIGKVWKYGPGNFAPRVGFAWDVFGDGKTSLRGGYGIGYERNFGNVTFNIIQNPPAYAVLNLGPSDVTAGVIPITTNNAGPLAGTGSKALPAVSLRAIDPNLKTSYTQNWNLSVEREFFKNTVLSVEYVGAKGTHLYDIAGYNLAGANPVAATATSPARPATLGYGGSYMGDTRIQNRINQQYGAINMRGSNGFSVYHGLNTRVKTSLPKYGLTLNSNWTYSHSIDNLSSTFSEGIDGYFQLGYLDPFNPASDKGNSEFDMQHRFVVNAIWEIPAFKNAKNGFMKQVFGGWSVAPIWEAHTGTPYTMYDCSLRGLTYCPRWMPNTNVNPNGSFSWKNAVGGNAFVWQDFSNVPSNLGAMLEFPICTAPGGVGCTLNPNNYIWPERNQFRGPGIWNVDMSFGKKFFIGERMGLQFRAEMFNIFNHQNTYLIPGVNDISSDTNMYVTRGTTPLGANDRRFVQLALRFTF